MTRFEMIKDNIDVNILTDYYCKHYINHCEGCPVKDYRNCKAKQLKSKEMCYNIFKKYLEQEVVLKGDNNDC